MFLSTQIFNGQFDLYTNYGKPLHTSRAHSSPAQTAASLSSWKWSLSFTAPTNLYHYFGSS